MSGKAKQFLSDEELKDYIRNNVKSEGMLNTVKYVWKNSSRDLKDSKAFVDEHR